VIDVPRSAQGDAMSVAGKAAVAVGRVLRARAGRDVALCAVAASCISTGDTQGVRAEERELSNGHPPAVQPRHLRHLRVDDTVGDLLTHAAFAGFGRLLLPWDNRPYDTSMQIKEIGSLLPYHSHVDAAVVVSSLNRMVDDAAASRALFHDFYTDAEKEAEPSRRNAGLFFFRGKPGAPFALIAPGGGFSYVGAVHEGFPYAVEINKRGYHAFVLKYRAGQGGRVATEDLAAALTYIMRNAGGLGVSTSDYALWGSSAGARMAAAIGSHGAARFGGALLHRPAAVVLLYTGHADVATSEPPTFAAVGENDGIAPPAVMERRVAVLRRAGTEVEYHRYPRVGHGFGLGIGTSAEGWIGNAVRFWAKHIDQGHSRQEGTK
jgi:acetyl esterase/lipase